MVVHVQIFAFKAKLAVYCAGIIGCEKVSMQRRESEKGPTCLPPKEEIMMLRPVIWR